MSIPTKTTDTIMPAVKIIDIFSGAGGASTGFAMGGAKVALSIECDPKMMAIHQANHPKTKHVLMRVGGDVKTFASEIRAFLRHNLGANETWHLHQSPPCQTFSKVNQISGIKQIGADERTNLTLWSLDLVEALSPPSWTIEQVPTALKHIHTQRPWTKNARTDVVGGWECGASVLRKRLFLSGGKARLVRTVSDIKDAVATSSVLPHLLTESPHEIRIRGSTNTVHVKPADGSKKYNRPIRWQQGERLRMLKKPCFAPVASCSFRLVHRTNAAGLPAAVSKTVGPQHEWSFLRNLTANELKVLQGFPADYDLLANGKHTLTFYESINSDTPKTATVRISETSRIHAVGNSVVPLVAKAFLSPATETRLPFPAEFFDDVEFPEPLVLSRKRKRKDETTHKDDVKRQMKLFQTGGAACRAFEASLLLKQREFAWV